MRFMCRSKPPANAGEANLNIEKLSGDAFFDHFEAKLKTARNMAFITNVMYSINWFLGFCSLTWASTAVLGGLLTDLTQQHYYSVVVLLVLEAVRLSTSTFFAKLVTWRLVHGSADPRLLVYNDARRQNLQDILRILEQVVQLTVIDISILVPLRRLQHLNLVLSGQPSSTEASFHDVLKTSLRIFYVLVLVNASIAGLGLIISKIAVPFFVTSFSLRRYYENIVSKGIDAGLLQSKDFDFLSWTFQIQADEYRRNVRAPVVKQLYGDMMRFLYYHRKHKGFEAAKVALESNDTFEREAAANIVGMWVSLETSGVEKTKESSKSALTRIRMQTKLLAKLADAVDNEESGRAASLSFEALAKHDPEGMLKVRSEGRNEKLADIFMDGIHQTIEMKKPNSAMIYIKAMIQLLPHLLKDGQLLQDYSDCCTPAKLLVQLKEDLWTIVEEYANGLKRLQAVAAHAYYLCLSEDERQQKAQVMREHLLKMPQAQGRHIWKDELDYLLEYTDREELPRDWQMTLRSEQEHPLDHALPWLVTALVPCLVIIPIGVVCSIFAIRYARF